MSNSFQMAVDHINTYIENVSVSLTLCEDFSNSANVLSNAIEASASDFLLGPYSSGLTNVLANYTTTQGKLLATSAAASTSVFANRSLVFGLLPPAREYPTSSLLTWSSLVENHPSNYTIGYFAEDSTFTRSMCSSISQKSLELGFRISSSNVQNGTLLVRTSSLSSDMSNVVNAFKSDAVDFVFGCTRYESCISYVVFERWCSSFCHNRVRYYAIDRHETHFYQKKITRTRNAPMHTQMLRKT